MEEIKVFIAAMTEDEMIISIEEYDEMVNELEKLRRRSEKLCG